MMRNADGFELPPDVETIAARMRQTIEDDRAYAAWAERLDLGILDMSLRAEERRAAELRWRSGGQIHIR